MPKKNDQVLFRKSQEKILIQSFQIFAKFGYGHLTTRQLAKLLGYTTGTLYHYFKSKEEIFSKMILLLTEQDILEGTELIKRGKSKQDKLALLLEFIESKKEYFRDLIYISNDCFRNPEKFKQEKILLERRFLNYANSITYEVGLEFADSGSIILSLLTGLVIQSEITPGQTSFDIKKQLIFLKEIKEVPQCDPSSKL